MEVVFSGLAKAKMGVQHNEIDYDKWTSVMEDEFTQMMRIRAESLVRAWDEYLLWLRENDPEMWETYQIAMGFWDEIEELVEPDCDLEQILNDCDAEEEYDCAASTTICFTFRKGDGKIAEAPAEPRNDRESMRPFARGPPRERVRRQAAELLKNDKETGTVNCLPGADAP